MDAKSDTAKQEPVSPRKKDAVCCSRHKSFDLELLSEKLFGSFKILRYVGYGLGGARSFGHRCCLSFY